MLYQDGADARATIRGFLDQHHVVRGGQVDGFAADRAVHRLLAQEQGHEPLGILLAARAAYAQQGQIGGGKVHGESFPRIMASFTHFIQLVKAFISQPERRPRRFVVAPVLARHWLAGPAGAEGREARANPFSAFDSRPLDEDVRRRRDNDQKDGA